MYTQKIDGELSLAMLEPSFARAYLSIVETERDYLGRWLTWPAHAEDEAFFSAFIHRSLISYAEGTSIICAMIYEGELVGNISLHNIEMSVGRAEIGYWVRESSQGKGIVTRAVNALLAKAFGELALHKVEIRAAVENAPSRRVSERLGFTLEGVITRAERVNDRVVDHAVYGLSNKAWKDRQITRSVSLSSYE